MKFVIVTIFPRIFESFLAHGIINRAIRSGMVSVETVDIRNFAEGRHRQTDDRPYGGGPGMVMMPKPLAGAIMAAREINPGARTILLTPQGRPFDQDLASALAGEDRLILVCGRYEGIDERACADLIDDEISIGDYVLTGGEPAAMVLIDAVSRLIPGVLGCRESAASDSFSDGLLEHAHYTRPETWRSERVPDVLLSGNHAKIEQWRFESSLARTFLKRPDLLEKRILTDREKAVLRKWCDTFQRLVSGDKEGDALPCADPLSRKEQK